MTIFINIQDNDSNVENFDDEATVKVDREVDHRLKKREAANDKKKKQKQPKVSTSFSLQQLLVDLFY